MDIDDVLVHRRLGMNENLARFLAVLPHEKLVEEEIHEVEMTRISHGLIIEIGDLPEIGFAHRPKPARCRKGFEL